MLSARGCAGRMLCRSLAAAALFVSSSTAYGGAFATRPQSASAQGSSFAGSAAGYDLSSIFWNPAAAGVASEGISTEIHNALLIPDFELTGSVSTPFGSLPGASSTDSGHLELTAASYGAYRISNDLVLALSINSPFGLASKPHDPTWVGRVITTSSKIFTVNASPTLSCQIAPGLFLGAGVQLEYMNITFKFASAPLPISAPNAVVDAKDNLGVGFTTGILWQPSAATSIGLGFRSSVKHKLKGNFGVAVSGGPSVPIRIDLDMPEIVTLSVRQTLATQLRLLGTIEWTNWSRFQQVPISGSAAFPGLGSTAVIPLEWHDGWFYSAGVEYDINPKLTMRSGVGFERSPIQKATERFITDSDRISASLGLTYRLSAATSIDLAYSHLFFHDAPIDRLDFTEQLQFIGNARPSVNTVAASLKINW